MIFNGLAVNTAPLGGASGQSSGVTPQPIVSGRAFRWQLRMIVGGTDMSARLSGQVEIDRERGAAGLATFTLQLSLGQVLPMDWVGRTVTIDYLSTSGGATTEVRRFTGRIVTTTWNSLARLLECQCSDQLQQRIEKMTVAEVDSLIPANWSEDVFESPNGRSRWDYAQERLGTLQASLDASAEGNLRLSSWYVTTDEHFAFGEGTTVYDSISVSYADLTSLTNTVEIEANYRFSRLHQLNETYEWVHPDTAGFSGMQGFCAWRPDSSELPDVAMIEDAASAAGLSITVEPEYNRVPLTTPDPCGDGQAWVNNYADLLLGVTFTGARRWTQSVTETYTLTVVAEESVAQAGEVISRESLSIDYTSELVDGWEGTAFGTEATAKAAGLTLDDDGNIVVSPVASDGGVSGHADVRDETQRTAALLCILDQAVTTVVLAHSATTITWNVPTSMVLDIDLVHTLLLDDQGVRSRGRCSRVLDTFDLGAGTALTTLAITVMRGGGEVMDALTPPAPSVEPQPEEGSAGIVYPALATQLGGKTTSPTFDDDLDGFAGNYDNADPAYEVFSRRFQITASEIAEDQRDEQTIEIAKTYRVAIPNDLLEL